MLAPRNFRTVLFQLEKAILLILKCFFHKSRLLSTKLSRKKLSSWSWSCFVAGGTLVVLGRGSFATALSL